jgi:hypothetical protein
MFAAVKMVLLKLYTDSRGTFHNIGMYKVESKIPGQAKFLTNYQNS